MPEERGKHEPHLGSGLEPTRETMRDMDAELRSQPGVPLDPEWVEQQLSSITGAPATRLQRRRIRRWIPIAAAIACLLPAATWLSMQVMAPAAAPASARLWPERRDSAHTLDNATALLLMDRRNEPANDRNTAFLALAARARQAIDLLRTLAADPTDGTAAALAGAQLMRIEHTLVEGIPQQLPSLTAELGAPGASATDRSRSPEARMADIATLGDFAAGVLHTLQQFDPQDISQLQSSKKVALQNIAKRFNLEPTTAGQAPFYVPIKTGPQ